MTTRFYFPPYVVGLVLAGGQGLRMGGVDKGWAQLQQKPLVQHVLERLKPQVQSVWISANRNLTQYAHLGHPFFCDDPRYAGHGPLSGILSFLHHLPPQATHIQLAPCDAPFLPSNLTQILFDSTKELYNSTQQGARSIYPCSNDHTHYACALIHRDDLQTAQRCFHQKKFALHHWLREAHAHAHLNFPCTAHNHFMNVNTLHQLEQINRLTQ